MKLFKSKKAMKLFSLFCATLLSVSTFSGCGAKTDTGSDNVSRLPSQVWGGCILKNPIRTAPDNIYTDSGIIYDNVPAPFAKMRVVYGITFFAKYDIGDGYLDLIADVVKQIFASSEHTDKAKQEAILKKTYEHGGALPVVTNEDVMEETDDSLFTEYSICDIVMYESDVRAMEVVEHILHTVTDLGFLLTDPDNFSFFPGSKAVDFMNEAIDSKYYDSSYYDDMTYEPQEVIDRILEQEFIYWVITSEFDIQLKYGTHEDEWTLQSKEAIAEKMPKLHAWYNDKIADVLSAPDTKTLDSILLFENNTDE